MIQKYDDLVNKQLQDEFSPHQIKNISLKKEQLEKLDIDIFIKILQNFQYIKFQMSFEKQLYAPLFEELKNLSQLRGLGIELANRTQTQQYIELLSENLIFLQNLKHFSYLQYESYINQTHSALYLSQEMKRLSNLEVLSFECQGVDNLKLEGVKEISSVFQHLSKLTTLNMYLHLQKQFQEQSNDLKVLLENISSLSQLSSLNLQIISNALKNNKHSLKQPFIFDISRLINLSILQISFSNLNQYLHIDLKQLPISLSKLQNLKELYIYFCHSPFQTEDISSLFDSAITLKQLQTFFLSVELYALRSKNSNPDIILGKTPIGALHLKHLQLDISFFKGIKSFEFQNAIVSPSHLEKLSLKVRNIKIAEQSLFQIANWIKYCTLLRTLKLNLRQRKYAQSFFIGLKDAFIVLPNLIHLSIDTKLQKLKEQELLFEALGNIQNLEGLKIKFNRMYISQQESISNNSLNKLIHLKSLKITLLDRVLKQDSIVCLSYLILNLKQISQFSLFLFIGGDNSFGDLVSNLKNLENAKMLTISLSQVYSLLKIEQQQELLLRFSYPPKLEQLRLNINFLSIKADDYFVDQICQLKRLRLVKVQFSQEAQRLMKLRDIKKLRYLVYLKSGFF